MTNNNHVYYNKCFINGFYRDKHSKKLIEEELTAKMCLQCHPKSRKYWVFGCGTFFMFLAIFFGFLWPIIANFILRNVSMN